MDQRKVVIAKEKKISTLAKAPHREPIGLRRLRHLLEVLKSIPLHDFDMETWGEKTEACGTHACLLGHASLDPVFRRQGLKGHWRIVEWSLEKRLHIAYDGKIEPIIAGRDFFHLEDHEATALFCPSILDATKGVSAKRQKISQLKELIKDKERELKEST